jgi:hypothetical protein
VNPDDDSLDPALQVVDRVSAGWSVDFGIYRRRSCLVVICLALGDERVW